jgi:serine/threonine-protein kinase
LALRHKDSPMESARWQQIQSLFHAALEVPPGEQRSYVSAASAEDRELELEVLAMLEADAHPSPMLDADLAQVAGRILPQSAAEAAGQRFGAYRILHLLGEGGMGVVYLAERDDLHSRAAIKILRDAWMSPARRERFAAEQRALAQMNHPGIARLYDANALPDGTPWFAMEYVEGVPLTRYCSERASDIRERLRLFRAVCEAVDYAHARAVLHRDLKPSNILVKPDGSVRLLDFGIAKQLETRDGSPLHTQTALRFMTPAYAAPEQLRGDAASIQSDVYSLGVLLYELLAGHLPFDPAGKTAADFERTVLGREPEKPSSSAQAAPGASRAEWADLDVLCAAAMHKDVHRRYRSVEALIRDLDRFFRGEPLESRPDTLAYRTAKFVRRNAAPVAVSAAALILLTVLLAFFIVRLTSARNSALLQAERAKRIQGFLFNLLDGGDKDAGPAEDLRVVALIDRGVQEAQSLQAEPAVQAGLYQTLGVVYRNLGKLDQADSLLQLALNRRRALLQARSPGVTSIDVAQSQIELGLLRSDQARLDDALALVREGSDSVRRGLPGSDPAALTAATAFGKVLEVRGEYAKAIDFMEKAIAPVQASGAESAELADALAELADNYFYAGHYDICDALFRRVLAMHRRFYGDGHPKVAEDLINVGATQMERGRYAESETYNRQAVAIDEKFYGPDHPQTASALTQLGRSLNYEKRFDEARALLLRALAIQERVHGPVHPAVASALNELGNIASQNGRFADAEAAFQRMVEIYRAVYHDHHYLIGTAESNLATAYAGEKQYARAEGLYRDAIARFNDTLPANHTNIGIARVKLGRVLLLEKRYAEAEQECLAGYRILQPKMSPSASWMVNARKDLRAIYTALGQPERASQFADPVTPARSQ